MKVSYRRVLHFLARELALEEMVDILTRTGLEVDGVEPYCSIPGALEGLVVGEVKACAQHPNADRLHVCRVDIGLADNLDIVCGAPNVREGLKVCVATVGTTLFPAGGDPFTIKKSKLRGEPSEGMLCAEDEIGLGGGHDGIMELDEGLAVGTPMAQVIPFYRDSTIEIGLTANRADAMSHYGVARDLNAYLSLREEGALCRGEALDIQPSVPGGAVALGDIDTEGVHRFCGVVIRQVRVAPSPESIQHLLRTIGIEPINNVVDITNLVLHDLGNPLHAYDLKAFTTGRVSVKRFPAGGQITTLDGKERKLAAEDFVVCDGDTPLCIAGVLGGQDSGVSDSTTDIFLEAAVFEPTAIRKTARRHGLNTDASFRFERGVDPTGTDFVLRYAAKMICDVCGGVVEGGLLDFYPSPFAAHRVELSLAEMNAVLGVDIPRDDFHRLMKGLEIEIVSEVDGGYQLAVPYYRIDVSRAEDVYEEVLRIYGFDRVPVPSAITFALPEVRMDREPRLRNRLSERLVGRGFHEIMALSFSAQANFEGLDDYPEDRLVKVMNPLSADLNVLRPTLAMGALEAVARNVARQRPNLRFFEFGHVFSLKQDKPADPEGLTAYEESLRIGLAMTGACREESWVGKAESLDIFSLKGEVQAVLGMFGFSTRELTYTHGGTSLFSPGIALHKGDKQIAVFGQLRPELGRRVGVKVPVFYAELDWQSLLTQCPDGREAFSPLPKFPEVRRDLALLVDEGVRFADLQATALKVEPRLIQRVNLFDVYEGAKLGEGKKSYALSFILQDEKGTLNEKAIDKTMKRLVEAFAKQHGAQLR